MADARRIDPSLDIQRRETERYLAKPLVRDDTWYLICSDWFKNFKSYIRLVKTWDDRNDQEHPGPIDNSPLYKDGDPNDIRDHLVEETDFVFVPEELWYLLFNWYGMVNDQVPIPKKVIEYVGDNAKRIKIEVYPISLQLMKDFDPKRGFVYTFSKADSIDYVAHGMKQLFEISDEVDIKMWGLFRPHIYKELSLNKTILGECLFNNQGLVIEVRQPNGTWIHPSRGLESTNSSKNPSDKTNSLNTTSRNAPGPSMTRVTRFHTSYPSVHGDTGVGNFMPGLCGLCNMGNTCFMNSVIQCLSNCPPLVNYFAEDRYLKDLNTDNPIGMKGKMATGFGELIKIMWSGKFCFTVPNRFKEQVGTFAPQFSGYQQQDSQELLTFLLDGLHEDLNKIKQKPYIELSDSGGRPDEVVASEAWEIYQRRNDSIIVDYFHGLLKSTVVCPDCEKVSVTFDPFCNLSLPLPMKREIYIEVKFFPFDLTKKPQVLSAMVPKKGRVYDLLCAVSQQCGVSTDELIVTEISRHHFHKFHSSTDCLENIDSKEDLAVYEVPCTESDIPVPVVLWEVNSRQAFNFSKLFGFPILLMLPRDNCTYQDIYQAVFRRISRYLKAPSGDLCSCHRTDAAAASSSRKCACPKNTSNSYPDDLFTLHIVNSSTASVIHKLHKDGNPIKTPFPDVIGQQYLAAQWSTENRKRYLNSQALNDLEGRDTVFQKRSPKVQLKDCLELFTVCETLGVYNAWYCPDCKQHQRATKKIDLWKLPKILIIHLKRFSYSMYSIYRRDKIDALVEFPLKDLDMSKYIINDEHPPAKYNLIGVCNHYGGMGAGHYTAYALNRLDRQWYAFDDHNVSPISPESVVTNSAYVLFYIKND